MSKASNLAGFVTSISPVNNLNVGVVTASDFVGNLTGNINAGIVTATSSANVGNISLSAGIVTAVSGIVTYYGDGSNLNLTGNTTAGVSESKVFFISARR
jgi:hypothetical protein